MDFARSTQAKSWMFSKESLDACRQQSLTMELEPTTTNFVMGRVRKFGSGFHRRYQLDAQGASKHASCESDISVRDQEVLIQFHAHQIQLLVGPNAIMYDLRTSENVLATAIIFFRRFYLSNSVLKVSPRRIAAACAFFAAKVEEEKIEISLLSHATVLVQTRVQNAPLCCKELRAVPVLEIEFAERLLMEGLNYEFCCHHSISTIDEIYSSLTSLSGSNDNSHCKVHEDYERFRRQSIDVAMKLLIFSDTPFLFNPCHAGFAICAIVMGVVTKAGYMGATLQEHLHKKSALTAASMTEHMLFADTVRSAIQSLLQCSALDLRPNGRTSEETAAARAENLRRVLGEVASIRLLQKMKRVHPQQAFVSHKRMRIEYDFTLPRLLQSRKYAKVTPTGQQAVEND